MAKFKPEEASLEILHFLADHDGKMIPDSEIAKHIGVPPNIANRLLFDLREDKAPRIKMGEDKEGRSAHSFVGQAFNLPPRKSSSNGQATKPAENHESPQAVKPKPITTKKQAGKNEVTRPEMKVAAKKTSNDMVLDTVDEGILKNAEKHQPSFKSASFDDVLDSLAHRPGSIASISGRLKADPEEIGALLQRAVSEGLAKSMDSGVDDSDIYVLSKSAKTSNPEKNIGANVKSGSTDKPLPLDEIDHALIELIGNGRSSSEVSNSASEKLGLSRHKIVHRTVTRTNEGLFEQELVDNTYILRVSQEKMAELTNLEDVKAKGETSQKSKSQPSEEGAFDLESWISSFSEEFDLEVPEDNTKGSLSIIRGFVESIQKENDSLMSTMKKLRREIDAIL